MSKLLAISFAASALALVLCPSITRHPNPHQNGSLPQKARHRGQPRDLATSDTAGREPGLVETHTEQVSRGSNGELHRNRASTETSSSSPVSLSGVSGLSRRHGIHQPARPIPVQQEEPSVPTAVRLADSVRLPAALMPPAGQVGQSPEIAEITAEIANDFYRKLQASAAGQQDGGTEPGVAGDDTAVIANSPTTEEIRESADEHFRALYGDESYNQQTLNSALEVRLPFPPEPASE